MSTVIAFIVIFGALVFFHELGHLIFAKRAGILCREFAIGFGPKVFSFKKDETVYTIRLLPIGGFVRMAGEDPEMVEIKPGYRIGLILDKNEEVSKIILNNKDKYPDARIVEVEDADIEHTLVIKGYVEGEEDESIQIFKVSRSAVLVEDGTETLIAPYDRQFASKTLGQRTMAIFAGPMMNFVLAFIVFVLIALLQGIPTNEPALGKLTPDGAAYEAGLKEGDMVQSVDGAEISSWSDVVEIIRKNPSEELEFLVERNGQEHTITVTPKVQDVEGEKIGIIGVYSPMEKSPLKAITYGAKETYFWTKEIFVMLGKLVTGQFSIDALSGPVGIYVSTDTVAKSGIFYLMKWAGILSINLGIMNLLPIPALDGGRLMFFAVEAVRGKPIDRHKEGMVHFIGFALLMLLMLVVTWNDIQRFFL
ncbi:RIP metalloprotease RseP [Cytobacillus firmus]|uniref:Zinc metalloprotease n=1 Tax=Cytobacillus firmus TaxID=1399 RepID=A0A380XR85_CYTFI|nr:RIP metalloprotease RseP [Cytobacillus firmus]KAF0825819.1 Intramembrane protease RasP/YluC, implicated in cell division based on FtsL cleavage [Cytobacillus firmus]MBG9542089.1 zinc metalloprotease [Cytobacillus firmus]MBG9548107.1 zinc metalloprotease [Cytobacillus firmus]MBG9551597.1 zinc metalloprotease [Cytobacillus firmus]MBG9556624.1 zinc metalloprotease [Cytobacillus firmus]